MSDIDPKKLKVAELREELKARGLDTKGNKAQLVKRLEKALKSEATGEDGLDTSSQSQDGSMIDTSHGADDSTLETSVTEATPSDEALEPEPEAAPTEESHQEPEPEVVEAQPAAEAEPAEVAEEEPEDSTEPEAVSQEEEEDMVTAPDEESAAAVQESDDITQQEDEQDKEEVKPVVQAEEVKTEDVPDVKDEPEATVPETEVKMESEEAPASAEANEPESTKVKSPTKQEGGDEATEGTAEGDAEEDEEFQVMDAIGESETGEGEEERRSRKRSHPRDRSRSAERDRRHSSERDHRKPSMEEENEDWLACTDVVVDRYNSDLNLRVEDCGYKCCPITAEGFGFMWAGCRSNYGITKGKVCYEVKVMEELNVNHLPEEETNRHVVRVGWSTDTTSLQLGEEPLSYGYGGTAKASVDCKFQDFGEKFGEGDVIGAYVDFDADPIELTYTKNGTDLGKAFDLTASSLDGAALFPHVLSKNCQFECNFGQKEEPYFPPKEGFMFINSVPVEERVRGGLPPKKKKVPTATLR